MFGDVVDPGVKLGSQKWYTVPLSIAAHVFIFGAIIIIPLMATDVLPSPPSMMAFAAAPPPPPTPPAPAPPPPEGVPVVTNPNAAPIEAPKEIKPEVAVPSVGVGVPGGVEGGVPGGVVRGVAAGRPPGPPPPPPGPRRKPQHPAKAQGGEAGPPADRAVRARPGRGHHRSGHRARRAGQR